MGWQGLSRAWPSEYSSQLFDIGYRLEKGGVVPLRFGGRAPYGPE